MSRTRQGVGRLGEEAAAQYLTRAGWRILHRNYRCLQGEIDIVAHDGSSVVFVEVRTRSSLRYGTPEESVTPAKVRRMATCALAYVAGHVRSADVPWRVDVIAIQMSQGRVIRLEHFKHALS